MFSRNTEKYIKTVLKEKEVTRTDKNGEEVTKNIFSILQCINNTRFIASSLLNVVNNLSEELTIKLNVNTDTMIKNVKLVELNINIATWIHKI